MNSIDELPSEQQGSSVEPGDRRHVAVPKAAITTIAIVVIASDGPRARLDAAHFQLLPAPCPRVP
ncbi:hypothetical protein ACWDZ6_17625 [Streptomyces sp. NPDC002926]